MDTILIFRGTSGLNTVDNPRRIAFNGGLSDLRVAVNISIQQSGTFTRRDGFKQVASESFHSLFADGSICLGVSDGVLHSIELDGTYHPIGSGFSDLSVSFCVAAGAIYYTDSVVFGKVVNGVHDSWSETADMGPSIPVAGHERTSELIGPFAGNHLAFFAGRIFIAKENVLFWSEHHNFGKFNLMRSFVQFNSKIRMIKPVGTGLFISTENRVFFLEGKDPGVFMPTVVGNYPALEWSDCADLIDGSEIGIENSGICALWNSPEGAIVGTPSGLIINITKDKIVYPENVAKGSSCLFGYNFIHGSF